MKHSQCALDGHYRSHRLVQIASFLLLCLSTLSTYAASISLFNTGVDITNSKLGGGAVDPHWKLVTGQGVTTPFDAVVVNDQTQFGQYYSSVDSAWIWANADGTAVVGDLYTFELQFDLTGYDASTAKISGFWSVDNTGTLLLNGSTPSGTGTFSLPDVIVSNHNSPHSFSITGGFLSGINRIDVQVFDDRNPGGLNVFGLTGTATPVPLPPALATFGAGFLVLLSRAMRRRSRSEGCA